MNDRVLILANAALSQSDSNGRTMAMLLAKYKPEQLAQFFTYGTPDFSLCNHYYRVTDGEALQSFFHRRVCGGVFQMESKNNTPVETVRRKYKRTPFNMLAREFLWKYSCWCGTQFWKWVDTIAPKVIFINLADNIFLIDLAMLVSKRYNIPIVAFSTEEYPFKKYNYLTKKPSILYWMFYWKLNQAYKRLSHIIEKGYFNSPLLRDAYAERYSFPCHVVMNDSKIDWQENAQIQKPLTVSYLGNLGINRHLPLIEIANAVANVCPGTCLDIYGKIPNEVVKKALEKCPNIRYCGFLNYDEVVRIIHKSTLVVHAESQEQFYVRDLRYAFSTKIADSVCSGTPFLIYGDRSMAAMDLMIKKQCAFICTNKKDLDETIRNALLNENARTEILQNAKDLKETLFKENSIDLFGN